MATRSRPPAAALLAGLAGSSAPAGAWGSAGHQAVGHVAERVPTAAALAAVGSLVAPAGLPPGTSWADTLRATRRDTAGWHFADTKIAAAGQVPAVDRRHGDCAIGALPRLAARMAGRGLPSAERQGALKSVGIPPATCPGRCMPAMRGAWAARR
ncbi:S1/P1 nuclease [Dankookia sp. GCM10030260]|uniref:S1/P1 nuclease n=1 Tax=Dankookia sp. GCM10030260 TaxID=3273390 RepID=UPI00361BF85D